MYKRGIPVRKLSDGDFKAEPSVTFVVIAFNEEFGIVDTLHSILNQKTNIKFSVLLIDDGSTDKTVELVEKNFGTEVQVFRQRNLGRGAARLQGISLTSSEFIAMVDADVRIPANWLQTCYDSISGHAGVGGVAVPDGDCATIGRIFGLKARIRSGSVALMGSNCLLNTAILKSLGSEWATRLGEDYRLNQILAREGYRSKSLPSLVALHLENKSFAQTLKWMYKSGNDATKLWITYKLLRVPDLAFIGFGLCLGMLPILFEDRVLMGIFLLFLFILLVGLAHLISKFEVRKQKWRLLSACLPNSALMLCYLLGRAFGLLVILKEGIFQHFNENVIDSRSS